MHTTSEGNKIWIEVGFFSLITPAYPSKAWPHPGTDSRCIDISCGCCVLLDLTGILFCWGDCTFVKKRNAFQVISFKFITSFIHWWSPLKYFTVRDLGVVFLRRFIKGRLCLYTLVKQLRQLLGLRRGARRRCVVLSEILVAGEGPWVTSFPDSSHQWSAWCYLTQKILKKENRKSLL